MWLKFPLCRLQNCSSCFCFLLWWMRLRVLQRRLYDVWTPFHYWVELCLVSLVGRAMLRMIFSSLLIRGAVFPSCCCWPRGILALDPPSCWMGLGLGVEMVAFRRAHNQQYSPDVPLSLSPQWMAGHSHLCRRPLVLVVESGSVSYEVSAIFSWVPVYTGLCKPSKNEVFVCLSPLVSPLAFNPDSLKAALLLLQEPQAGKLDMRLQDFHSCGSISVVKLFSSLWATHVAGMEFDYTVTALLLVSHCLCLHM